MSQTKLPRLYLNENIPVHLVSLLANLGITAMHTLDVNNRGATDEFQLRYAAEKGYVVVTHNRKDFKLLHKRWIEEKKFHFGILVMSPGEPGYLADRIKRFFDKRYSEIIPPFCEVPPQ